MGNRAVITTGEQQLGVYLHWNGGWDSVEPFLAYCKAKGYRPPERDNYGWSRLCQVIGNYFGGANSIGVDKYSRLDKDNGDNGVYLIKDWKIVGRKYFDGEEQREYNFLEMLKAINSAQPESERLTRKELIEIVR